MHELKAWKPPKVEDLGTVVELTAGVDVCATGMGLKAQGVNDDFNAGDVHWYCSSDAETPTPL